jgi:hypothetical protein
MSKQEPRRGRIGRIEEIGLGVLVDEETKQEYPFTLDKVKGYHGEPLKAFSLKKGSLVRFLVQQGRVDSVEAEEESGASTPQSRKLVTEP